MSVDKSKLLELNNLVSVHFRRKHKIILNPAVKEGNEESLDDDINSPLYMKTLYDWVEGLQYYGGKNGNITQYKNFGIRDLASIENVPIAREVLKLNKKEPSTPTENGR